MTADTASAPKWEALRNEVLGIVSAWKTAKNTENPSGIVGNLTFAFKFIYSASNDLVELVETSQAIMKADKKETVVEAIKYAYTEINPDLPWIPEPFETQLENWILDSALPPFIDWMVNMFNEKGIFSHDDAESEATDETSEISVGVSPTATEETENTATDPA